MSNSHTTDASTEPASLDRMPTDILLEVSSHLPKNGICNMAEVCRSLFCRLSFIFQDISVDTGDRSAVWKMLGSFATNPQLRHIVRNLHVRCIVCKEHLNVKAANAALSRLYGRSFQKCEGEVALPTFVLFWIRNSPYVKYMEKVGLINQATWETLGRGNFSRAGIVFDDAP